MAGDVLLCGADAEAKATVGALVEKIPDLRWADAGALSMARIVETFTAVLVHGEPGLRHPHCRDRADGPRRVGHAAAEGGKGDA